MQYKTSLYTGIAALALLSSPAYAENRPECKPTQQTSRDISNPFEFIATPLEVIGNLSKKLDELSDKIDGTKKPGKQSQEKKAYEPKPETQDQKPTYQNNSQNKQKRFIFRRRF